VKEISGSTVVFQNQNPSRVDTGIGSALDKKTDERRKEKEKGRKEQHMKWMHNSTLQPCIIQERNPRKGPALVGHMCNANSVP
jgi:hypothetical protein